MDSPGTDPPTSASKQPGSATGAPSDAPLQSALEQNLRPGLGWWRYLPFGLLLCVALYKAFDGPEGSQRWTQHPALYIGLPMLIGTALQFCYRPRSGWGRASKLVMTLLCAITPLTEDGAILLLFVLPFIPGLVAFVGSLAGMSFEPDGDEW